MYMRDVVMFMSWLAIVIGRWSKQLEIKVCVMWDHLNTRRDGHAGNENEVAVGSDFTELHEIKDEQSDTVNKDRQHEKYRYN
jgi:hypothetical protein